MKKKTEGIRIKTNVEKEREGAKKGNGGKVK